MMVCLIREGHCRLSLALKPFLQPTGKLKLSWHDHKHPEKHVLRTTGVKLMNVAYRYFVVIPLSTLGILHLNVLKLGRMPVSIECQLQLEYSQKLQKHISETTIHSIRDAFCEESAKRRYLDVDEDIETMPKKKRGRKLLLGEKLDQKLQ